MDEETFDQAAACLPTILAKLSSSDLLYFYARFKQAKEGPNERPKPGFFDFQGKQKWQAWKDLGKMTKKEAMTQYVEKLESVCPEWREKDTTKGGLEGSWVSVSTMKKPEESAPDEKDKTLLDFVKEGDSEKVRAAITEESLNLRDDEGMSALHWAADRGEAAVVEALLRGGADRDAVDGEGQTALHYAASCGHARAVALLIEAGADRGIKDRDGLKPADVAADDIKQMFK